MNSNKPHFSKLSTKDFEDLLDMIIRQQCSINIWSKGNEFQENARVEDSSMTPPSLTVQATIPEEIYETEVLLNFSLTNRMYFATATIKAGKEQNRLILEFSDKIFKCEQRKSFRLSSSPTAPIEIVIDGLRYTVSDVSVSGIAIVVSKTESVAFKEENGYDNVLLEINSRQFNIPFCKVIHKREYRADSDQELVGLEFIEVDRPLEIELYKAINDILFSQLKS